MTKNEMKVGLKRILDRVQGRLLSSGSNPLFEPQDFDFVEEMVDSLFENFQQKSQEDVEKPGWSDPRRDDLPPR